MKKSTVVLAVVALLMACATSASAQRQIALGAGVDLLLPVGAFGDSWGTGFGISGQAEYSVSPHASLTGKVGYISWSGKSDLVGTCSGVPLLAGLKYYPRFVAQQGTLRFYGHLEIGMTFVSWSAGHLIKISESQTSFTLSPSIGAEISAGATGAVDISVRYYDMTKAGGGRGSVGLRAGYKLSI